MKYTLIISFETEDWNLGDKIISHVQDEYATAWVRNKAHGKVYALEEKCLREPSNRNL